MTPLGRAPACSRVSPAASSIFRKRGGARPRVYPLFMRFRALLPTTWVWFRAESGWAGRRGGDGGERPGRAGAAERCQLGCHPRGVQTPGPPRRGSLGTAVARGPEGFAGGAGVGGEWGCAHPGHPKCRGKFPPCPAREKRAGPGGGVGALPLRSVCSGLGG